MFPVATIRAVLAALLFTSSTAQLLGTFGSLAESLCEASGNSALQCQLCGYIPTVASTYACEAYNATFDDGLTSPAPIPIYRNAQWNGFTALKQTQPNNGTTLSPYSGAYEAAVMPGQTGTLSFGYSGGIGGLVFNNAYHAGTLHYFHYACAYPSQMDPPTPVACAITVTASCLAAGITDLINGPYTPFTTTLYYDPSTINRALPGFATGMQYTTNDFGTALEIGQSVTLPQTCQSYSFSAVDTAKPPVGPDGNIIIPGGITAPGPVILLDDVIYTVYGQIV